MSCSKRAAAALASAVLLAWPVVAAAEGSPRPSIRLEEVASALQAAHIEVEGAKVRLMAEMTATIAEPRLEVRSVERLGDRGARVRMACAAHEQCLPFYVGVEWADAASAAVALRQAGGAVQNGNRQQLSTPPAGRAGSSSRAAEAVEAAPPTPSLAGKRPAVSDTEASVHAGGHATLVIDGQRLHIKVPVICLENGVPGRTIRVTGLDHKQVYLAEVVDSTLLKGTL